MPATLNICKWTGYKSHKEKLNSYIDYIMQLKEEKSIEDCDQSCVYGIQRKYIPQLPIKESLICQIINELEE